MTHHFHLTHQREAFLVEKCHRSDQGEQESECGKVLPKFTRRPLLVEGDRTSAADHPHSISSVC